MGIRPLSDDLQVVAVNELNEDSTRVDEYINHLREWLLKQPHLTARQDDHFLLLFLRGCKFSLQKAKEKIDNYYSARAMIPEYYGNKDPFLPEVQLVVNAGYILPLSQPTEPGGSRVLLLRWSVVNPKTMPIRSLMKVMYMIIDILLEEDDNAIVAGLCIVVDFKNFPVGYTIQITPGTIYKCALGIQSAYPLRLKANEYINVPNLFDTIFAIMKQVFSQKLLGRTHVYTESNTSNLFQQVPQSIFPKEYGGSTETIEELRSKWKKKIEDYSKWFKEDEKYFCNEKLRPDNAANEIFGANGTFRKINID